ncbi:MAG: hypothetical protein FWC50_07760, partial [Planctomycetaceae bacterium]|nr:hypothetical protein [Planctomycetaceae bacterium]
GMYRQAIFLKSLRDHRHDTIRVIYSSRLKIPEAGHRKPCNAGRLRKAEGCRPYRLRYTSFQR